MALFKWKEYYSVNINSIDLQHKKLVTLINSLHNEINNGFNVDEVNNLISQFKESTKHHFETEENLLKENDYKLFLIHKEKHDELIEEVREFGENLIEDRADAISSLNIMIEKLKHHFLEMDRPYSPFLTARGVS